MPSMAIALETSTGAPRARRRASTRCATGSVGGTTTLEGLYVLRGNLLFGRDRSLYLGRQAVDDRSWRFPGWVYEETPAAGKPDKERPRKINDHGCDAMRGMMTYLRDRDLHGAAGQVSVFPKPAASTTRSKGLADWWIDSGFADEYGMTQRRHLRSEVRSVKHNLQIAFDTEGHEQGAAGAHRARHRSGRPNKLCLRAAAGRARCASARLPRAEVTSMRPKKKSKPSAWQIGTTNARRSWQG